MKKVLFAYPGMRVGGSTTSLLSILNSLDYTKYQVDLSLAFKGGELIDCVPKEVHILELAYKYQDKRSRIFHRLFSPRYMDAEAVSRFIQLRDHSKLHALQYVGMKDVEFYKDIDTEYDVAISFLEGRTCRFVANHVKAKKKIAWIHVNYVDAGFDPKYDKKDMSAFDKIVFVSDDCKSAFDGCFPELSDRTLVIENILSANHIRSMADEMIELQVDTTKINLVTTCRITFESKALDRAVKVINKIKQINPSFDLRWYIIGDGGDYAALKNLIYKYSLQDEIILLGSKVNPYPYLEDMSLFFLPSRREGKPMSVTEAFMMGLPALVTEYSSAREQVKDGVDGIIVENSEEGIYKGLLKIIENPELINELKKNVVNTDYSNVEEMKKVEQLIDG